MKPRIWILLGLSLALLAPVLPVGADTSRQAVRDSVEMSMLVTGSVDIDADGHVIGHTLDQPDKLPLVVRKLIDEVVPQWRFEPVKLGPGTNRGRARMGLRVIAKKTAPDSYSLRIGGASFGAEGGVEGKTITSRSMRPPQYPQGAARARVSGTVYLILKIGREGAVEDAFAEQVNLTVLGNERQMTQGRKLLSDASTLAARRWRFNVPTQGDLADDPAWFVRVPVAFMFPGTAKSGYGEWLAYVPGPRNQAPWRTEQDAAADALIAGEVYPVGSGPKLLTPLAQG
jgi:hypothetical protein